MVAADGPSPYRIFRTNRLAELFDVDPSTIWRWRQDGTLPQFVKVGGVSGLTEVQLAEVHEKLLARASGRVRIRKKRPPTET